MSTTSLSIILPTYNGAKFLRRTIDSVLQQDWQDYELIILDNASTDDTPALLAEFQDARIRKVRHPENIGMVRNINAGIRLAQAPAAIILCSDDHWAPDFLSRSMAVQQRTRGLTFTNSMVLQNGQQAVHRNVFQGLDRVSALRLIRHLHGIPLSSLIFPLHEPRELFDERLPFNCDLEFVLRLTLQRDLPLNFIDWPGVYVNLHEDNETRRYNIRRENVKLLRIVAGYAPFGLARAMAQFQRLRLSHG